jgi:hypothetical protein
LFLPILKRKLTHARYTHSNPLCLPLFSLYDRTRPLHLPPSALSVPPRLVHYSPPTPASSTGPPQVLSPLSRTKASAAPAGLTVSLSRSSPSGFLLETPCGSSRCNKLILVSRSALVAEAATPLLGMNT